MSRRKPKSTTPDPTIKLHYWFRSNPLETLRFTEMSPDATVSDLQNKVASQLRLQAQTTLQFYQVPKGRNFSMDGDYEHELGMLSMSDLGKPLRFHRVINSLWGKEGPEAGHLHLIVTTDLLPVTCWVRGTNRSSQSEVWLRNEANLCELKSRIQASFQQLNTVPISDLTVYKLLIENDDELDVIISRRGQGELFSSIRTVGDSFKNVQFSSWGCHVIVEVETHSAESHMKLHYWVRGDPIDDVLDAEIPSTATVKDLRKAIKDDRPVSFRDVDPSALDLYQVTLPSSEDRSLLGVHPISTIGTLLLDSQKLSEIFGSPPLEKSLHLIVDCIVPLQCWARGAAPMNSFTINIPTKAKVDTLKDKIKIPACDKAMLRDILDSTQSGQPLEGNELVKVVFGDVPPSLTPRIVVEPLYQGPRGPTVVPSAVHARALYLNTLDGHRMPPSQLAMPKNFNGFQLTDARIDWARPPGGTLKPPATLLDPIFGRFFDECRDESYRTEDKTNALAMKLQWEMSKFFDNERERQNAFNRTMRESGMTIIPTTFDGMTTDGDMHLNGYRYMFLEVKSEVGSTGAEPYCQALLYYERANAEEVRASTLKGVMFNFPSIIVTLFGPHLGFSGVVWGERPSYQLLSTVPLFSDQTDVITRRCVARHLSAFENAIASLRQRYKQFDEAPEAFKGLQPTYPHPRSYQGSDGEKMSFSYIKTVQQGKLLFLVETAAGKKLCVKFTHTYDRRVHEECALRGIAPPLRGLENIPGGWIMVVMDYLDGYDCLYEVKGRLSPDEQMSLKAELHAGLVGLHQERLVHGDVRDANVMVRNVEGKWKWCLVDFDWSGVVGEVRYPMNVHRGLDLERPEDVADGNLILAGHDIGMLDYIFA